jgi:hypothetical protein
MTYSSGAARALDVVKSAAVGLALAGGLAVAAPAAAANVTILSGTMHNQLVVDLSGVGAVYDAPMEFKTIYGGAPRDLVAFCVDVFHHISLGDYAPDLLYTDVNPFNTAYPYASPALTADTVTQIGRLVHYGTDVFNDLALSQPSKKMQLGAVQGAIWEIVANTNVTLSTSPSYAGLNSGVVAATFNTLVDNLAGDDYLDFIGGYGPQGNAVTLITPTIYPRGGTQSFLFAAVPEPATWSLMIGGFGLVGAVLRSSRRRSAGAVA